MIKYDAQYNQEINRVVSNFNRKVRRLEKEERALIPSPVRVRDIKTKFTNRTDLNRYLRDLKRFSIRGAENLVQVNGEEYSRYQIDIFKRNLRRERDQLRRDIKEAESITHRYPMQHDVYTQNLRARKLKLSRPWGELIGEELERQFESYWRKVDTFDNYFEIMFQDAYLVGFEDEKINYIKERLLKLNPRQFDKLLRDSPEIKSIFDYYHSLVRQRGELGASGYDKYQALYENIDNLVEKFK